MSKFVINPPVTLAVGTETHGFLQRRRSVNRVAGLRAFNFPFFDG